MRIQEGAAAPGDTPPTGDAPLPSPGQPTRAPFLRRLLKLHTRPRQVRRPAQPARALTTGADHTGLRTQPTRQPGVECRQSPDAGEGISGAKNDGPLRVGQLRRGNPSL
ncbi:hypothetical protein NDU88_002296 [Pleurodeles waltl]|uniref:Uncharacterized protein n=1 Tax=Pleurodeles waltl TaxID=8319 RepID=A0AAV7SD97_PLEWA|nr:hypothetical protein NDU88_002296 [Pleurodeles waltl]